MGQWPHSINRNIVECKEEIQTISTVKIFVLIETLWNVKYIVKIDCEAANCQRG